MIAQTSALIVILGLSLASAALVELTSDNFESSLADGSSWFIKFFAPWCGHCKKLAPTWKELGDAGLDTKIGQVDCTQHKDICSAHGVRGYPSLLLFPSGSSQGEKYSGQRTLEALKAFASSKDEL